MYPLSLCPKSPGTWISSLSGRVWVSTREDFNREWINEYRVVCEHSAGTLVYINSLIMVITGVWTGFFIYEKALFILKMSWIVWNITHLLWINYLLIIITIILLYRMVLCSLESNILLLFRKKESNDDALYPVSSVECIGRIVVMAKLG